MNRTTAAHRTARPRRAVAVVAAIAAVATLLALAPASPTAAAPAPGTGPDPGAAGPLTVDELTYDLGDEAFLPNNFPGAVEIRGKVYAPTTISGAAPLVVIMHGRHIPCATEDDGTGQWPCPAAIPEVPSYQGYDALGELLASHGAVVVSIGANGINAVDGDTLDQGMDARGQLYLEHLRLWAQWNTSAAGPFGDRFVGHVDTSRIGLMGHSRGGEGAVVAAVLNQRRSQPYGIQAVVALAPVDFEGRILGGVPLQVVLPYCDGDVSDLQGAGYYDDARYATPGDLAPKQTTLIWGANHNFFNTVWTEGPGSFDDAEFGGTLGEGCDAGTAGRLTGPQQATAGAAIMGGFLRRHLFDDTDLEPFVTGVTERPPSVGPAVYAVAHHAPDRLDLARWNTPGSAGLGPQRGPIGVHAATPGTVCKPGFSFFIDVSTIPACPAPGGGVGTTGVLDVGWVEPTAVVRTTLTGANGVDATAYDGIRLRLAFPADARNDGRLRQGASVRVVDVTGASSTVAIDQWSPTFGRRPSTWVDHSVLNGVRVPLSAFSGVDLGRVRAVEVRFDRTDSGRALLSDLAFTAEGTGEQVAPADPPSTASGRTHACGASAAARWACAVSAIAWARPPYEGNEMNGLTGVYGSRTARNARISTIVDGPTAGATALAEAAQVIAAESPFALDIDYYVRAVGGSWEQALAAYVEDNMWLPPVAGDPGRLADRLFLAVLGRLPDPASRAHWAGRIENQGAGATTIALLRTAERAERIVTERYQQIVGWTPDAASRTFWVDRVRRPGGEKALVGALLRSDGFTTAPR